MSGEVEDSGLAGFGLNAVFAGFGANINFAALRAIQLPQRLHFLFGFGQRFELAAAQRQCRAINRLLTDGGIAERQQGKGGRISLAASPLRLHFAQDRQRGRVRYGATFNHVAIAVGEQRLERQVPELVIRRNDETRFATQQRLRGLQKKVVELARRSAEPEVAPGELIAKTFGALRQFRSFDRQGEYLRLGGRSPRRFGHNEQVSYILRYDIFE